MNARARQRLQKAFDRLEAAAQGIAERPAAGAGTERLRADYQKLRADYDRLENITDTASERLAAAMARLKGALEV